MATNFSRVEDTVDREGYTIGGYSRWDCERCGREVRRYRGQSDVDCQCGASYNAGGQRLRDDWRSNPAWSDPDFEGGDLEGFETSQLRREMGR